MQKSPPSKRRRRPQRASPIRRRKPLPEFSVIVERDADGWYLASVPALRGCHTQARSLDTLMDRVREAIEVCLEDGDPGSLPEFIGVQRIAVG